MYHYTFTKGTILGQLEALLLTLAVIGPECVDTSTVKTSIDAFHTLVDIWNTHIANVRRCSLL